MEVEARGVVRSIIDEFDSRKESDDGYGESSQHKVRILFLKPGYRKSAVVQGLLILQAIQSKPRNSPKLF